MQVEIRRTVEEWVETKSVEDIEFLIHDDMPEDTPDDLYDPIYLRIYEDRVRMDYQWKLRAAENARGSFNVHVLVSRRLDGGIPVTVSAWTLVL